MDMRTRLVSAVVAAAVLAACSSAPSDSATSLASDSTTRTSVIDLRTTTTLPVVPASGLVVPECDDDAMCALGFVLDDGIFYNLDCAAIEDALVTLVADPKGLLFGFCVAPTGRRSVRPDTPSLRGLRSSQSDPNVCTHGSSLRRLLQQPGWGLQQQELPPYRDDLASHGAPGNGRESRSCLLQRCLPHQRHASPSDSVSNFDPHLEPPHGTRSDTEDEEDQDSPSCINIGTLGML